LRDGFGVMIGGGPTSRAFAQKIGADGQGRTAKEAVELAHQLARRLPCAKTG
jgi:methanogenic corrinoid protein MtbC1